MTVHSHCVENFFEDLLQRYLGVREGWVRVVCKKNTMFPEQPVFKIKVMRTFFERKASHFRIQLD